MASGRRWQYARRAAPACEPCEPAPPLGSTPNVSAVGPPRSAGSAEAVGVTAMRATACGGSHSMRAMRRGHSRCQVGAACQPAIGSTAHPVASIAPLFSKRRRDEGGPLDDVQRVAAGG